MLEINAGFFIWLVILRQSSNTQGHIEWHVENQMGSKRAQEGVR